MREKKQNIFEIIIIQIWAGENEKRQLVGFLAIHVA